MQNNFENLGIVVYFPCGAGGKFIINCLSLSQHCVVFSKKFAKWELTQPIDNTLYQAKLAEVLKTIPPTVKDLRWQDYEMEARWIAYYQDQNCVSLDPLVDTIVSQSKHLAFGSHVPETINLLLKEYPNFKNIVKLTNYTDWMIKSSWKLPEFPNEAEKKAYWDYVDKKEISESTYSAFLFDIDNSIHIEDKMVDQVERMYKYFNFDDFKPDIFLPYYRAYINANGL